LIQDLLGDWWRFVWNLTGTNGPPLAQADAVRVSPASSATMFEAQAVAAPLNVLANDIDPEDDPVTAIIKSTTTHGALVLNTDGTFDYTADPGFIGVDVFTYAAYDFVTESAPATVRISVGLRGDYEGNGAVDGTDFVAWQRNLGATASQLGSGADGDGDGDVDGDDLLAWKDNFGVSNIASAAAVEIAPVPETAAALSTNLSLALNVLAEVSTSQTAPRLATVRAALRPQLERPKAGEARQIAFAEVTHSDSRPIKLNFGGRADEPAVDHFFGELGHSLMRGRRRFRS
jgi:hypothetical protein